MNRLLQVPLFVILMGIGSAAMLVPALHAWAVRDWATARSFLNMALLFGLITLLLVIAMQGRRARNVSRAHLVALPAFFAGLPLMLALPFHEAVSNTTYLNSYFEMVSSLTTTGATLFDDPNRLAPSVHLWRALVGWMGGLFIWITAFAVLSPINMGGFEVTSGATMGRGAQRIQGSVRRTDPRVRLLRFAVKLTPIYAALTVVLWIFLIAAGDTPLIAACHAMSTLATSGISPVGGLQNSISGRVGEAFIIAFLIFGITRLAYHNENRMQNWWRPGRDPEVTMALILLAVVPAFLFLRHWVGAYEVNDEQNFVAALKSLWGSIFSVMSFLTTTGFVSADWIEARNWSGLQSPGMILLGLSLMGGGVATTAGGVKLMRVYALYRHGVRELNKLVHPHSVGGSGQFERRIRRQGAMAAWVFFMLFALSIALVMTLLSLTGESFESATVLSVAALSTTGPIVDVGGEVPIVIAELGDVAKLILAFAMVLGRMEMLVVIALLNPELWRS